MMRHRTDLLSVCLAVSVLLHGAVWQMRFSPATDSARRDTLKVELSMPHSVETTAARPVIPAPARVVATPAPSHASTRVAAPAEAQPVVDASPAPVSAAVSAAAVAAAAPGPTVSTNTTTITTPPAPDKPLADSAWLSKTVTQLMNARKRYPRMAQKMGLEGMVMIEAVINERGQLVSAELRQSSGHEMLDQDALALLKSVMPLSVESHRLPAGTRVQIPIRYQLQ